MGEPHAYDDELRERLTTHLAAHERWAIGTEGHRHAAVAVVVVDSDPIVHGDDPNPAPPDRLALIPGAEGLGLSGSLARTAGGPAVLLTRRATHLRAHGGQWALPGGRIDEGESVEQAVLRELREEIGLVLDATHMIGLLDDYATRSGFVITPVVFWGGDNPSMAPDPAEVQSIHRVSFRELQRPDSPRFVRIPESEQPVVQMAVGGDLIHAPTGAILLQFRRVALEGVTERVRDYEQPVFAWR
jgi:8-oxo-dGTP pyrophosphatase MutT (NUDIX family)